MNSNRMAPSDEVAYWSAKWLAWHSTCPADGFKAAGLSLGSSEREFKQPLFVV